MNDREKVIRSIKACAHHPNHDCESCDYCDDNFWCFNDQLIEDFETMMKKKEIVRCKDCIKRRNPNKCPVCVDAMFYIKDYSKDEWFCADGVKK